jgi:hypothetical protein
MESHEQQTNLVREQFTRTAEVFGDYAVASRVGEADLLAHMVKAGAKPGDRAYIEARHLMAASIPDHAAWFHPRYELRENSGRDLVFTNTTLFIAGKKL